MARMGTGGPPGAARFSLCSMTLTYEATQCQVIGNSGYISVLFTRKITRQGLQLDDYFLAADRCCCKMMAKACAGMHCRASGFACSSHRMRKRVLIVCVTLAVFCGLSCIQRREGAHRQWRVRKQRRQLLVVRDGKLCYALPRHDVLLQELQQSSTHCPQVSITRLCNRAETRAALYTGE